MKSKLVSFTAGELNSSGVIEYTKDAYMLETQIGIVEATLTPTYKFARSLRVKNVSGADISFNLLTSGEIADFSYPDNNEYAAITLYNGENWYPNYMMPLSKVFRISARAVNGVATSGINFEFLDYCEK